MKCEAVRKGHSLFGVFPDCQLAPPALEDDPQEIAAVRTDVRSIGVLDLVGGRECASHSSIREHLGQYDLEREHAGTLPTTIRVVVGPSPDIIRDAEERPVGACALWAGQV